VITPTSPLARVLLSTDGTVSYILEAYADEPIEVVKLSQTFDTSTEADTDLDMSAGAVLRRRVVLRGQRSLRSLVYAEALVALDRVEPAFLKGLVGSDQPIGLLLAHSRTETFREILRTSRRPAGSCAVHLDIDPGAEVLSRTYRIVAERRPIVVITERFTPDVAGESA
jgi:chorismate-pyruvate lyase